MLPRSQRLTTVGAKFISKRGRSVSGGLFRIKWALANFPPARATIVVGLAVEKRATRRNRIKRRVREALRPFLVQLRKPVGLMVFPNKACGTVDFSELQEELGFLLKRAGLL